jgi:autotransporter-associated beta strand protein
VLIASAGATTVTVAVPSSAVTDELVIDVPDGQTVTRSVGQSGAIKYVKRGLGTLVLDASSGHTGTTTVEAGTLVVNAANALASSATTVQAGGTLRVNAGVTMRAPSLTVAGGTVDGTGATILDSATSGDGVFTLPSDRRQTLALTALTVDQATGGRLDIGKGRIDVAVGGTNETALRAEVVAGRSGGTFAGTSGIMTTGGKASSSSQNPAVGYRILASGAAIVAWAAYGDINLDGQVNSTDVTLISNGGKFGQGTATGATWAHGDFNYSGGVNATDISLFTNAALFGAGSYLPVAPTVAKSTSTTSSTSVSLDAWIAFAIQSEDQQKRKA